MVALLLASAVAGAVTQGQSLSAALEELRSHGLRLIFSSVLVRPDLTVNVDVGGAGTGAGTGASTNAGGAQDQKSLEATARRILAPHGLTLEAIRPGLFSVVKMRADDAARPRPGEASVEAQLPKQSAPSNGPLYEVDVYASRYLIDQTSASASLAELSREDVESLPGLDQDVMRVTHFLPGTASNSLSARSHVRGGRDDELAVFFDGVPLFEPFHYKDVQSLLGLLDPGSISKIDFFSGVFPARYGNRLSGVLDIAPRTWSGHDYNEIGASVLYTHALSQGRLESYPVEWLVTARRGNIEAFSDLTGQEEARPDFLDSLMRFQLDTGPRSTIAVGGMLLDDQLSVNFEEGVERGDVEYRDATGWASWRFRPDEQSELRATASRTERHTNRVGSLDREGSAAGTVDDHRVFDTTTLRLEGSAKTGARATFNAGLEWYDYLAQYNYRSQTQIDPLFAAVFGSPASRINNQLLRVDGEAYAAFASALLNVSRHITVDLALRWDAQRFDTAFSDNQLSPRLSLQYQHDPATVFRLSWGRMAQTERPDELQVQDGEPIFHAAQRSTQTVISVERKIQSAALLRIEAYDKRIADPTPIFENLLDPFALLPEIEADRVRVQPDSARVYGAELSLRWQLPNDWSGWTSYSWSEATDHFGPIGVLRTWDQKHAVATGLAWRNGAWQYSTNLNWHSGWRRNTLVATNTTNGAAESIELAPRNSDGWSQYVSLDLRAVWTRDLPKGALQVFAEVDNATN
ncbi:MAG TPA: TonB-dependent receptor, partial [Steroidobacteraceae bacterium]|nr:TonB-dependent receptor [Steroidobacteraceae bacterium]